MKTKKNIHGYSYVRNGKKIKVSPHKRTYDVKSKKITPAEPIVEPFLNKEEIKVKPLFPKKVRLLAPNPASFTKEGKEARKDRLSDKMEVLRYEGQRRLQKYPHGIYGEAQAVPLRPKKRLRDR